MKLICGQCNRIKLHDSGSQHAGVTTPLAITTSDCQLLLVLLIVLNLAPHSFWQCSFPCLTLWYSNHILLGSHSVSFDLADFQVTWMSCCGITDSSKFLSVIFRHLQKILTWLCSFFMVTAVNIFSYWWSKTVKVNIFFLYRTLVPYVADHVVWAEVLSSGEFCLSALCIIIRLLHVNKQLPHYCSHLT